MTEKEELIKLKERLKELTIITSKEFKTSEELQRYVEENKHVYEEAHDIYKQIDQLEWDFLTPEEKARKEERRRLSKLKRDGKLF
ncbi:hypothetical protein [Kordia sp.]|uniref:hypothetical protein n=1 Tax=Kordia sp. TaxID=1965332 RepID=UPI003D6C20EA